MVNLFLDASTSILLLCNKENTIGKKDKFQNSNDKLTLDSLDKIVRWVNFEKKGGFEKLYLSKKQ